MFTTTLFAEPDFDLPMALALFPLFSFCCRSTGILPHITIATSEPSAMASDQSQTWDKRARNLALLDIVVPKLTIDPPFNWNSTLGMTERQGGEAERESTVLPFLATRDPVLALHSELLH
jgi:hypothetical protein